jgi:hypothetical protein
MGSYFCGCLCLCPISDWIRPRGQKCIIKFDNFVVVAGQTNDVMEIMASLLQGAQDYYYQAW